MNIKNNWKNLTRQTLNSIKPWRLGFFLSTCLFLGGTSQDILKPKVAIYLVSLFLIGAVLCEETRKPFKSLLCPVILIGGVFIFGFAMYLVPLPPEIWTTLPGRDIIVEGFALVEKPLPWMPLSLTPEITLFSLLNFLPLIAISLIVVLSAQQDEIKNSYYVIVGLAVASVFLGVFQVLLQAQAVYFYDITSDGFAVGFFSNANHNATFLAMAFPLALYMSLHTVSDGQVKNEKWPVGLIAAILIVIGIVMTGSTAGYLLLIFVVFASTFTLSHNTVWQPRILAILSVLAVFIILDLLLFGEQLQEFSTKFTAESSTSRSVAFSTTMDASRDFGVFGSGPGSFQDVYKLYEDRGTITRKFLPHAHNDYLQVWLEMGVLGSLILIAGLVWFITVAIRILRKRNGAKVIDIIFIIILLVPIIHSTADYPLRTISISSLFFYVLLLLSED